MFVVPVVAPLVAGSVREVPFAAIGVETVSVPLGLLRSRTVDSAADRSAVTTDYPRLAVARTVRTGFHGWTEPAYPY